MQEAINFNEVRKQIEKAQRKQRVKEKFNNAIRWMSDNKEIVVFVGPAILGSITGITRMLIRQGRLRKEKNLKNLYCYDRSLGHYWKLKRELTNPEWVAIDKRKQNGERLGDILDELKVLK